MSLVSEFATGTYQVVRMKGTGTFKDGFYVPGPDSQFKIVGSLQPVRPKDLLVLPELERNAQSFNLYTDSELFTAREVGKKLADRVTVYGEKFVVMQTERWDGTDLP